MITVGTALSMTAMGVSVLSAYMAWRIRRAAQRAQARYEKTQAAHQEAMTMRVRQIQRYQDTLGQLRWIARGGPLEELSSPPTEWARGYLACGTDILHELDAPRREPSV